jgi:hypothetical protein
MSKRKKITGWPVMPVCCPSCPFRESGDMELRNRVMERTALAASQICHHPRLHGGKETHLCRGARNEQLTVLHRLGWIAEPTDAAFAEASHRALVQNLDSDH